MYKAIYGFITDDPKIPDLVDVSKYDPEEYKGTYLAMFRDDPNVISIHEQYAYQ